MWVEERKLYKWSAHCTICGVQCAPHLGFDQGWHTGQLSKQITHGHGVSSLF